MSRRTAPPHRISPEQIAACVALVRQVGDLLGPAPRLTAAERMRRIKLPKGGEAILTHIAAISEQLGAEIPPYPTAVMREDIAQAVALVPLREELASALKHVSDVIFEAESESWRAATAHYTLQRKLARKDGTVAKLLAPVTEFFRRPARGKAPPATSDEP